MWDKYDPSSAESLETQLNLCMFSIASYTAKEKGRLPCFG